MQTPLEQVLGNRFMEEVNRGIQLQVQLLALQKELQDAKQQSQASSSNGGSSSRSEVREESGDPTSSG